MGILDILLVLLVIGWITGFGIFHVTAWFIHLLLLAALIGLIFRLIGYRPR